MQHCIDAAMQQRSDAAPAMQRSPTPVFSTFDEPGPQCIAFDVTTAGQEMIVVLDWKALETPLIEMALAGGLVVGVIAHGVGQRDPAQETAHATILGGLQDKVPVVGHQLIAKYPTRVAFQTLSEDALKSDKIFFLVENGLLGVATVESVVEGASFIGTFGSGHEGSLATPRQVEKSPDPF